MATNSCIAVDEKGYELISHGSSAFPIAFYRDNLGEREVPWHWHDEWEAVLISEGRCTLAAGNRKYTVGPGEGFFLNGGLLHGCWDLNRSGCRFHSLVFHPRLVGGNVDSVFYQTYVLPLLENPALESVLLRPGTPWQREALDAIERAWQLGIQAPAGHEFAVRTEVSRLIFLLWQNMPLPPPAAGGKTARDSQRIKTMLAFIREHCADPIDTRAIAASALISESECLRCFRATIHTTPMQYLKHYRIQRSAQLLAATGEKIADIAVRCGFQDMSYFTKTFRLIKGCTPSEYRRNEARGQGGNE